MSYTKAEEDYLEAIYLLGPPHTSFASCTLTTPYPFPTPPYILATFSLSHIALIQQQLYTYLSLTKNELTVAEDFYSRHPLIKQLLIYIGVSEETAEKDCCKIEHTLSGETVEKLRELKKRLSL